MRDRKRPSRGRPAPMVPPARRPPGHNVTGMLLVSGACFAGTSAVGCAQTSGTYSGTATLLTSGASSPEVSPQSVRVADCSTRAHPRQVLDLGDQCNFIGRWTSAGLFVGEGGGTCLLPRPGAANVRVRVTDVTARFPSSGRWVDPNVLDVRMGGDVIDESQPARHALFTFSGALVAEAPSRGRCAELHLRPPS